MNGWIYDPRIMNDQFLSVHSAPTKSFNLPKLLNEHAEQPDSKWKLTCLYVG